MHGKRPTVTSLHGVVAAAHPLAAQAGARMLSSGGNAFDAAAATAAALNVVEPYMSGLAGQGYATCHVAAEKRVRTLNFVNPIPRHFPVERFRQREDVARGALSVGTPGNLAGWCELVRAYGRKTLAEIFAPAIALARDGYPLIEFNVAETNGVAPELRRYKALYEPWAATYTDGGSGQVAPGFILRQPDLARTLEAIAAEGPDLFFRGALGRAVVAHLADNGGCLTMADLEAVAPQWNEPLAVSYRGLKLHTLPPPCEGFQFLLTLRLLEGVDLARLPRNGVEHLDLVWRAIRIAAGVRIAHNHPTPETLARLLGETSIGALRRRLLDGTPVTGPTEQWTEGADGAAPAPAESAEHHTTSFSIADRDGNLVCVTQSLGSVFGSGIVVPGTGLCLNNFLYWADVNPRSPNRSVPGGPFPVCMAPTIATRGDRAVLALGTPGSYGILQTQVQALVQHVDYGLKLQEAIEAPRTRLFDGRAAHPESRIDAATLAALRQRGHDIVPLPDWHMRVGGMQAVAVDPQTGAITGACDPRRDGYVATA